MAKFTDIDMGNQHGRRRRYLFGANELDIQGVAINPGVLVTTQFLYAPGFVHFTGQVDLTTPVTTTVLVSVTPILEDNTIAAIDRFTVATITTGVPVSLRYPFYWGAGRGLITDTRGATYCFSAAFRLGLQNTGANPVTTSSIVGLECIS